MNDARIIRQRLADPFARIPKDLLNDTAISWKSKAILCYLLGKPDDWKVRVRDVENHGKEGAAAVLSGLKELRVAGYAKLQRVMEAGRVREFRLVVADSRAFDPVKHDGQTVMVKDGVEQEIENQHLENLHVKNRHSTKKVPVTETELYQEIGADAPAIGEAAVVTLPPVGVTGLDVAGQMRRVLDDPAFAEQVAAQVKAQEATEAAVPSSKPVLPVNGVKAGRAVSEGRNVAAEAKLVLKRLVELSGIGYRDVPSNTRGIEARLRENGVTLDGVLRMVEHQTREWKGTEMEQYLRPETLFRASKFDGYYARRDAQTHTARPSGSSASRGAFPVHDWSQEQAGVFDIRDVVVSKPWEART